MAESSRRLSVAMVAGFILPLVDHFKCAVEYTFHKLRIIVEMTFEATPNTSPWLSTLQTSSTPDLLQPDEQGRRPEPFRRSVRKSFSASLTFAHITLLSRYHTILNDSLEET